MAAELYWCGTIRCYARQRGDGWQVALFAGVSSSPTVLEDVDAGNAAQAVELAIGQVLARPRPSLSLVGLHNVPRVMGGGGPVLSEVSRALDGPERVRADLGVLQAKGWDV